METALLVAQLFGPVYAVVGISILLNKKYYYKMVEDFIKSPGLVFCMSFLIMPIGLLILMFHNEWNNDWTVLVTILGWLILLKGLLLLLVPEAMMSITKKMIKNDSMHVLSALIAVALGGYFTYVGYFM